VKVDGSVAGDDVARPVAQWWGSTLNIGRRNWVRIAEPR
jgi:hypothetical protein